MCAGRDRQRAGRPGRVRRIRPEGRRGAQSLYSIADDRRLNHRAIVDAGLLADESAAMLKAFFASPPAQPVQARLERELGGARPLGAPGREQAGDAEAVGHRRASRRFDLGERLAHRGAHVVGHVECVSSGPAPTCDSAADLADDAR